MPATNPPHPSIVISGAALISCLGADRETTWRRILRGECGAGPLSALELPLPPDRTGGQAVNLPFDDAGSTPEPRASQYLRVAITDALRDARLDPATGQKARGNPYPADRCGFMLGTTLHGMRSGGEFLRSRRFDHLGHFLAGATLRDSVNELASTFGIGGFAATTCSACSSSLGSIALAVTLLQAGKYDLIVAGGYDTISEYAYAGFNSLRLVADGPLRPFARDRQGMKLGEGFGIVILEREADARGRGAHILARVLGCGESADAHHLTQPHPQGDGAARAIASALETAGISIEDVGLIAAHATGTPDNDAGEFAAMSKIFGDRLPQIPVVAFKSHLAHTLGGAGAVELILSAMALRDQVAPPCANMTPQEVEFSGLSLTTGQAKPRHIRATLNTSLGFGGANTCVVLGASDQVEPLQVRAAAAVSRPSIAPMDEVFITGIGVVVPGAVGNEAFVRLLADRREPLSRDSGTVPETQIAHLLNSRRIRRISDYAKFSLAATTLALADAGVSDIPAFAAECSAIAGTSHGSAEYCQTYYQAIVREGLIGANPMLFAEGVPNAAAAHLSLMLSLKGACQTIIGTRTAGLDALRLASLRIAMGQWSRAVVSVAEEFAPLINSAYGHCGVYTGQSDQRPSAPFESGPGFVAGAGAVTVVLESRSSMSERGVEPRGKIENAGSSSSGLNAKTLEDRIALMGSQLPHGLNPTEFVIASANGTWIDRSEAAMLQNNRATVGSLGGHIAECFSVIPLAGIAAVLLSGRMPPLLGGTSAMPSGNIHPANGQERPEAFSVLASDYTGLVAGLTLSRGSRAVLQMV